MYKKVSTIHCKEDLAKSGYKLEIKYKILIILLYIWPHNEKTLCSSLQECQALYALLKHGQKFHEGMP